MRFGDALRRDRPTRGYVPARHPLATEPFLGYYYNAQGHVVPHRLPSGWHNVRIRVPQRLAGCSEIGCNPVPCGMLHKVPTGQPALYLYDTSVGGQVITHQVLEGEFIDRLAGAVDHVVEAVKLGSYD